MQGHCFREGFQNDTGQSCLIFRDWCRDFRKHTLCMHGASCSGRPYAHVLSVLGEGEVRAVPDQAQLSVGVMTQAQTAAAALAANSRAMNEVYATIRKTGVLYVVISIQTLNFSVSPQYPPYQQDRSAERGAQNRRICSLQSGERYPRRCFEGGVNARCARGIGLSQPYLTA